MRTIVPFVLSFAISAAFVARAQPGAPPSIDSLEKKIADGRETVQDRITLMNLYLSRRDVEKRREQVLWLAEHHPEIPNFRNPPLDLGLFGNLQDPAGVELEGQIWRAVAARPNAPPAALVNAAYFFRFADRDFARSLLRKLAEEHPGEPNIAKMRGIFDVLDMAGLVEGGPLRISSDAKLRALPAAKQAREEIESTSDANLICGAAEFLQQQPFIFLQPFDAEPPLGGDDPLDLAERWLLHAQEIAPGNRDVKTVLGRVYATQGNQTADPKYKVALLRKADSLIDNFFGLPDLAMAEFDAGDNEAAAKTAKRMLDRKPAAPNNFINSAHTVLGLIALDQKRMDDAKAELFESIKIKGSLNPNRTLAQALVDAGEKETVLKFLEQARAVWLADNGAIDHYIKMVKAPGSHDILGGYFPGQDVRGREAPKLPLDDYKGKAVAVFFRKGPCTDCDKDAELVSSLAEAHGALFVSIDAQSQAALARQYDIESYPTVVLINTQGRVTEFLPGRMNENNLRAAFDRAAGSLQRLPSPVQTGLLEWKAVPGAESYIVQLDQKDDKGWMSDRDQHLVRVIPASGTSATLDSSLGETSAAVIRWRVYAVNRQGPGRMSEWREESLKTGLP